mgnify:CR=1 FL=1
MELLKRIQNYNKKLIFRMVMTALMLSIISVAMPRTEADASQATLSWDPPTSYSDGSPISSLGGYKIYTGTAPGNYSQNIDVGNITSYILSSLNDATTYYFAVIAYDASGVVSDFSNQAVYTTPAPPPPTALYTLTASAGSGGSITPSGAIAISQGLDQTFTITPSSGYKIANVTVDGASVGAVSTYTFSNVAANHTISATFYANTTASYAITASTGIGGSITPAGTTNVNAGAGQVYTLAANTGNYIVDVKVDGVSVGRGSTYTFSNVTSNHTISATFATATYTITASPGVNGNVTPAGTTLINYGTSQSCIITPNSGYKISDVTVDGVSVGAVSTYTFSNVTANHTIAATFVQSIVSSPRKKRR